MKFISMAVCNFIPLKLFRLFPIFMRLMLFYTQLNYKETNYVSC
jgi:hypothetical protein